ncbi:hypothetical protein F5883DRAFT_647411 [Diaporthe sp. PMI_573]|nr:hypothetical protein F5883DRAFT_647411 [Diaporthaceae sp. PMI_573]
MFDHLVEHGADVRATTTRRGILASHLIFWKPKAAETETYMLSELSRRGRDVLARDTPLRPDRNAVAGGRVESPEVTIEPSGGIAVPLRGSTGLGILLQRWDMYTLDEFTALHLVSSYPTLVRAGVLYYFLNRCRDTGLHVYITDGDGDTPLHYASLIGGGGWERLVGLGADPGIRNAHGMTPADLRFRGHMYQITKDSKGFPLKHLDFIGMSLPYSDRPDEVSIHSLPTQHGTPLARLWDRVAKGVVFRDVWDVEAGEKHTLSDDVGLVLRFGDMRR